MGTKICKVEDIEKALDDLKWEFITKKLTIIDIIPIKFIRTSTTEIQTTEVKILYECK